MGLLTLILIIPAGYIAFLLAPRAKNSTLCPFLGLMLPMNRTTAGRIWELKNRALLPVHHIIYKLYYIHIKLWLSLLQWLWCLLVWPRRNPIQESYRFSVILPRFQGQVEIQKETEKRTGHTALPRTCFRITRSSSGRFFLSDILLICRSNLERIEAMPSFSVIIWSWGTISSFFSFPCGCMCMPRTEPLKSPHIWSGAIRWWCASISSPMSSSDQVFSTVRWTPAWRMLQDPAVRYVSCSITTPQEVLN